MTSDKRSFAFLRKITNVKHEFCKVFLYNNQEDGMENRIANIVFMLTLVSALYVTVLAL